MPYISINQIYPSSESLGIKWDRFGPLPFTFHTISGKNQRKLHVKSIKKGFKMKGKTFAQRPFSNPGLGDWEIIEMQKSEFFLSVFFFTKVGHKFSKSSNTYRSFNAGKVPIFLLAKVCQIAKICPISFHFPYCNFVESQDLGHVCAGQSNNTLTEKEIC